MKQRAAHLEYWRQITAPSLFKMSDDSVPRVWIVGSSIIRRLYAHVCEQGLDRSLGLSCKVKWEGRGGRLWEQLLPVLRSLRAKAPAPDILIIHLGGNSLCREGRNRLDFLREMKTDLAEVFRIFPRTRLLFSFILPRLHWRGQTARSAYGVERSRRWLNGAISGFLAERQMRCIRHSNIDLSHLTRDGVHLSPEGNELLLSNLREALEVTHFYMLFKLMQKRYQWSG
ncbi:hypothetical protein Q8A67_001477 [Cirrhinus molitorella]|uniref:SGNH hydrolase-type esterase domain-containing protein n=1 Tax=Cirrhinus molitorella TaxID=172907 RepID=A0AA88QH94_9TELE|nr:hypothetical protein Q8A67_001477 [Cirrhinus molitorella]